MADDLTISVTDTRVRKWGRLKLGISDYGDSAITIPTTAPALFDSTTHKPKAWPAGVKELGYLTTDGISAARSVSSNDTQMLQSLTPVRSDLESMTKTLKGVLGESNAWTNALYHGLPVSSWPATKDAAWMYADGVVSDQPEYVLWLAGVDGVGAAAIFRVEMAYRVKVTSIDERAMNRSSSESFGLTFGLYVDPVTGKDNIRAEEGPGYTTHLTYT